MSNRFSSLGLVSAAVLAAASLAACGATTGVSTGNFSGDSRLVAQTISNLQSDAQNDDKKVCDNDLASSLVVMLKAGGADCATVIKNQLNEVDSFDLTLDGANSVTVSGTTATARVKSTSGSKTRRDTLTLVKEGGRWKISGLGG